MLSHVTANHYRVLSFNRVSRSLTLLLPLFLWLSCIPWSSRASCHLRLTRSHIVDFMHSSFANQIQCEYFFSLCFLFFTLDRPPFDIYFIEMRTRTLMCMHWDHVCIHILPWMDPCIDKHFDSLFTQMHLFGNEFVHARGHAHSQSVTNSQKLWWNMRWKNK